MSEKSDYVGLVDLKIKAYSDELSLLIYLFSIQELINKRDFITAYSSIMAGFTNNESPVIKSGMHLRT